MPQINLIDTPGRAPYAIDSTRSWVEQVGRKNGLLKPQVLLRVASDTNYIRNGRRTLYGDYPRQDAKTKAVMNLALPGMRIPGVLNWQVTENLDQTTQTASFEALNCLPVGTTQTTISAASGLNGWMHTSTITASYVANSLFVTEKVLGNGNVELKKDVDGYPFTENNVKYRTFAHDTFDVVDASAFPNPAIPNDDDNDIPDDTEFVSDNYGTGSYYLLVDNEVIRVVNLVDNTFHIPSGGRAVNGILEPHGPGSPVRLLGFAPYTGEWCGMGYLNIDDFSPQSAILRPGTAMVSYEGYGDIAAKDLPGGRRGLTHDYDEGANYTFTGYWFVSAVEPSIGEDGVPKVRVDLKGTGYMYDQQKISPDLVRRIKNPFGQWRVNGKTIWSAAQHNREIPGDWVDYDSWDPTLAGSYPLKINIEFAQHKAFAEHMAETNMGKDCLICREEHAEWLKTHKAGGANAFIEDRAVGRHIYKESIRVMQAEAGPIKTYIRLVSTLAAASWDHPPLGNDLGQRMTKIPNKLFDNIRNIHTGLIYNGQVSLEASSNDDEYDWFTPGYDDTAIMSKRIALTCPFESTYDNSTFSQPMIDLAEVNGCTFWVNKHGYPVFIPRSFSARPSGRGFKDLAKTVPYPAENNEWFAAYGGSLSQYSHNLNADQAFTQCWVSATTPLGDNSMIQVLTGGTGYNQGRQVVYSGLGGNREGLSLTSGVQAVQTYSLDNQMLGLDWNTDPGWGTQYVDTDGNTIVAARPPLYDGEPVLAEGSKRKGAITQVQRTIKFFMIRKLMRPYKVGNDWILSPKIDGKFGKETEAGVNELKHFLNINLAGSNLTLNGKYDRATYNHVRDYLNTHEHFVKNDIFWYVAADVNTAWERYVTAILGIPITLSKKKINPDNVADYVPVHDALIAEEVKWSKGFAKTLVNVGNRIVDEALDKATARSISSNIADPRVQVGDVIWCEVPGFLGSRDVNGNIRPPFTNGIYVTSLSRQMDMQAGSYTATYSGYRSRGYFNQGMSQTQVNAGYDFVT